MTWQGHMTLLTEAAFKPRFIWPPFFALKHSVMLLTWTCCFCAFSMLGSMDRGPSTPIISSFSISQGRSWASAAWKQARWLADSSSCLCRAIVTSVALSHRESVERKWENAFLYSHQPQSWSLNYVQINYRKWPLVHYVNICKVKNNLHLILTKITVLSLDYGGGHKKLGMW